MTTRTVLRGQSGYSLTELMVTIGIVGILSALGSVEWNKAQVRTRYQATTAQMLGMQASVMGHRALDRQTLMELTGSGCTACTQGTTVTRKDFRGLVPAWNAQYARAWGVLGVSSHPYDAWKRPLSLDENELEGGPGDCRHDSITSAGADGMYEGVGGGDDVGGDDIMIKIPFYRQRACP